MNFKNQVIDGVLIEKPTSTQTNLFLLFFHEKILLSPYKQSEQGNLLKWALTTFTHSNREGMV